jgi:hypothetical protein
MLRMPSLSAARLCSAAAAVGLSVLAAMPAPAAMYRWVDDTGAVVYSQSPPPDGRAASTVTPPPPPSSSADAERQQFEGRVKQADEARKKQQEGLKKQQEASAKDADRKRNCDAARQNLELILNRPPQTRFQMPNGEFRRFTDEEREAEIKKARDFADKNCR